MSKAWLSRKVVVTIVVAIALLQFGVRTLLAWHVLDSTTYGLVLGSGLLIVTLFVVWQSLQMAPKGFATSSQKSLTLNSSYREVCELIPKVMSSNHWKLLKSNAKTGHFKARIGMSLHTFSSTFLIDLNAVDERSVNIRVFCGTRSVNDPGHNDRMITKFFDQLENVSGRQHHDQ